MFRSCSNAQAFLEFVAIFLILEIAQARMDVIAAKVVSLIILFVLTMIFGLLPLKIISHIDTSVLGSRAQLWLSRLNCFAGGVFLGSTLLHLLPEVREQLEVVFATSSYKTHFPYPEFMAGCGFFLVFFLEHLVLLCKTRKVPESEWNASIETGDEYGVKVTNGKKTKVCEINDVGTGTENTGLLGQRTSSKDNLLAETSLSMALTKEPVIHSPNDATISKTLDNETHLMTDEQNSEEHFVHTPRLQSRQNVRSLLLLVAMSFHSVFGGFALGLSMDSTELWALFAAVSIHKCIIVFTLGFQLAQYQTKLMTVLSIVIFSTISPIGAAIGTAVMETDNHDEFSTAIASSIMQGLATGTFLYVTFFEILVHEFESHDKPNIINILFVLVGFGVMTCMCFFEQ